MAILYVAKDGNDANSGATWALAKLTMGGAHSAASANDTIYVAAGRYSETVAITKVLFMYAVGEVINDNSVGGLVNGFTCSAAGALLGGFIADGFTSYGFASTWTLHCVNCIARNNGSHGFSTGAWSYTLNTLNCVAYGNGGSGIYNTGYAEILNNVCFNNSRYGIEDGQINAVTQMIRNNVCFGNTLAQLYFSALGYSSRFLHNYNHLDLAGTTNIGTINATNYTTLALFQAALTTGAESNDSTGTVELNDVAKYLYHTLPSSTQLLGTGIGGNSKGLAVAYGMSENLNLAKITGGVFSDVEWDAVNKRLQLVAPASSGYWRSDVIDLGCVRAFFGVGNIYATMAPPTDVVDYDVAEADPRTWTYRYRIDNATFDKADGAPAWVEAIIMNPLVGITGRYVQVELTLRTDGV